MKRPPELEFFDGLRGYLQIELSEPAVRAAPQLFNLKAPTAAKLKSLRLQLDVFEAGDLRPLTEAELASVAFDQPEIRLRGESGDCVEHRAPNGRNFTVRDLIAAVETTERQTRGNTDWIGGIDVHHVYFEGLEAEEDGSWSIFWGS